MGLFEKIKPWVAACVSLLLLGLALWVIVRKESSADDKKSAWTVLASVLAFWIGSATSGK